MYMVWLHGTVGRSSVSGRRTFPVLHSTCSLWVTTIVSKTICYILLQRLQTSFGLNSSVLLWFCSYLDQRQQYVHYCGKQSVTSIVQFGVPQGSVLGPLLFVMYTADIVNIVAHRGLSGHQYADDIQAYGRCRPNDATSVVYING